MVKKELKILGVKISLITRAEVLEKIKQFMAEDRKRQIVTPNPEFLLTARQDEDFCRILNEADLSVPDGIGLKFAGWFKGVNLTRYTGADLTKDLLALAEANGWRVAVINWHAGLSRAQDIAAAVKRLYPELKIMVKDERRGDYVFDLSDVRNFKAQILFVGLGAPYQEKLIAKILSKIPAKLGLGVGGSFDYLTGRVARAPRILSRLGLEWTWRLLRQPRQRLARIGRAVVVFPVIFLMEEVLRRFFYRRSVVGFLFQGNEVLLVNADNGDGFDHWKLPQGGADPLETKEAALWREMAEELGTVDFKIVGRFDNIYRYKWPSNYRMSYKGQKQTLFLLKYKGRKDNIKLSSESKDFKWVKIDELVREAELIRRPSYVLFLRRLKETVK